jgi:UDP-N-acetylglucosamine 2-epimerase (non-hydrolysing)
MPRVPVRISFLPEHTVSPTPPPAAASRLRIALVAGTRPECLKLASTYEALRGVSEPIVIGSGQHPAMVARTFGHVGVPVHHALAAVPPQTPLSRTVRWLRDHLRDALRDGGFDAVVVQGDTSTAYAGALAGKAAGVPVAHLEAGLRTHDPRRPFPEEPFRRWIAPLARWHFAPTPSAKANLLREGIADAAVEVTGNPIVDLLRSTLEGAPEPCPVGWRDRFGRLATLTLHRRENYGRGLDAVCEAVIALLDAHPDLGVVCPVHPNPQVGARMTKWLGSHARVILAAPLDYRPFVRLLSESTLVITDSGGIQEEVPYLGVPTLVVREETERPECLATGCVRLVPPHPGHVLAAVDAVLAAPRPRALPFDAQAPFGDGRCGVRVAQRMTKDLG